MKYFKLNNPSTFKRIQELFLKRQAVLMSYKAFAESMGCNSFYASTSIFTGVQLYGIGLNSNEVDKVDRTRWKKPKVSNSSFLRLNPLKSNKEFYKQYIDQFPKETFEYDEILSLSVNEKYNVLATSGITLHFRKDHYFIISLTESELITTPDMIEISVDEFSAARDCLDTQACW